MDPRWSIRGNIECSAAEVRRPSNSDADELAPRRTSLRFARNGFAALAALAVLAVAAVSGCASVATTPPPPKLPFRVAVIPVDVAPAPSARPAPGTGLELESLRFSRELAARLRAECFTDVVLLEHPGGSTDVQFRESYPSPEARLDHWRREAERFGADLLLSTKLQFQPDLEHRINAKFYWNLGLFLLGGPFCWFVDDRTYFPLARLNAQFSDMNDPDRRVVALEKSVALYAEEFEVDLDFWTRSSRLSSYLLSFLVPAGLLATEGPQVNANVGRVAREELGDEVVSQLLGPYYWRLINGPPVEFTIAVLPDRTLARREPNGTLSFQAEVFLETSAQNVELERFLLTVGKETVVGIFPAGEKIPGPRGLQRYRIRESIPGAQAAETVRLIVEAPDGSRRSFTFGVSGG